MQNIQIEQAKRQVNIVAKNKPLMRFPVMITALLSCLVLTACGSNTLRNDASADQSASNQEVIVLTTESQHEEILAVLPERPMTTETLELLLEAEFSGYRGEPTRIVELYLQAARDTGDPQLLARTVQLAIEAGDLDRAMQAAVLWYESEPENNDARTLAVQMLARNGEPEAAWLIAKQSNSPILLRLVASETASNGTPPQLVWLGQEIEIFGADKQPHSELYTAEALLLNELEREAQAAELARQALILDPTNINAMLVRVSALAKQDLHLEAATTLESWILSNWNREEDRIRVIGLFSDLDGRAADASLVRLYTLHPESMDVLLALAENKVNIQEYDTARSLYLEIAELEDFKNLAHVQLGRIEHSQDNFTQAFDWYSQVSIESYYQYAQDQIAAILIGTDRSEELVDFFADQRRQYPNDLELVYTTQARHLASLLENDELMAFLDEALSRFPDSIDLRYSRSLVAERIGRMDIAETDLRAILALDENNANALNALGYALTTKTDRFAEAYSLIERALAIQPDSPAIQDSMGWVLYKLGEYEGALQYLRLAQDGLYDPEVIAHHAEVLWKLNRVDEALNLLSTAMLRFPGNNLLTDIRIRILDDLENS